MNDRPTFIYFVQDEAGQIKIGKTRNVFRRVRDMQVASGRPLTVLGVYPGVEADERKIHERFRKSRVHGEWFSPAPEIIRWVANNCHVYDPDAHASEESRLVRPDLLEASRLIKALAPVCEGGSATTRVARVAKMLGWGFQRARSIWNADNRVRLRPEEVDQLRRAMKAGEKAEGALNDDPVIRLLADRILALELRLRVLEAGQDGMTLFNPGGSRSGSSAKEAM